jgi:hypothetical protein
VVWRRHGTASSPHAAGTGSAAKAIATHAVPQRELPGRRIAGVVLLDDAPAPGVQVRTAGAAPVVSDASGHFDLGVQRIARHVVVAEPPNVIGVVSMRSTSCSRCMRARRRPTASFATLQAGRSRMRGLLSTHRSTR